MLENRTLQFGCNDVVVVGRIENGAYQSIETENDLLGHGRIAAQVHVRKVVRGGGVPTVLPVRYFAHSYMREDREFMFVLERTDTGYEIKFGQLMALRPLLASRCH